VIAIERALPPWGLALAALAIHENRRYVQLSPKLANDSLQPELVSRLENFGQNDRCCRFSQKPGGAGNERAKR
jgi:hypothetical protein